MIGRYADIPHILEQLCLAEFVAFFEEKPRLKKETGKEIPTEIDNTDNNIDIVTPGTGIKLADGSRLVHRKTPKVIHYVKFNALKDTELYYGEQLMLLSSFRKEMKLVGTSDSFESQYKLLVERKHQQTPSISN